jgi:hypothetical protein
VANDEVWAVGTRYQGPDPEPLIMRWDGGGWSEVPPPATSGTLYGVTSLGPSVLWAVANHGMTGLLLHWDGTSWTETPAPPHVPGTSVGFNDVSAESSNDVRTVGSANLIPNDPIAPGHPFVIRWDGSSWSEATCPMVPIPWTLGPPGAYNLFGVATASGKAVIVGGYPGPEQWNQLGPVRGYRTVAHSVVWREGKLVDIFSRTTFAVNMIRIQRCSARLIIRCVHRADSPLEMRGAAAGLPDPDRGL